MPSAHAVAPTDLGSLLAQPSAALADCDIARRNLLCAQGLPGCEAIPVESCLGTLDAWSARVKAETERHLYRFRANPQAFENSEGYFRLLMMAVVVCEDFHVQYSPERIAAPANLSLEDHFFADARDIFLPGLLGERRQGTCSSMPVLYVALGRRCRGSYRQSAIDL